MIVLKCRTLCQTATAVTLQSPPCFVCTAAEAPAPVNGG